MVSLSYIGKDPSLIFDGSLPFGTTPREYLQIADAYASLTVFFQR